MTPIIENIVKELRRKFPYGIKHLYVDNGNGEGATSDITDQIENFLISSLNKVIEERDKQLLEEIEKMRGKIYANTNTEIPYDNFTLSSIAEFIKNNNN